MKLAVLVLLAGALALAQAQPKEKAANPEGPGFAKVGDIQLLKLQLLEQKLRTLDAEFRASQAFVDFQKQVNELGKEYDAIRLEACAAAKLSKDCRVDTRDGSAVDVAAVNKPPAAPAAPAKNKTSPSN